MSDLPTPKQQAVLDALGTTTGKTTADLAFEMGLSYHAVYERLVAMWGKRLVTRGWVHGKIRWWTLGGVDE